MKKGLNFQNMENTIMGEQEDLGNNYTDTIPEFQNTAMIKIKSRRQTRVNTLSKATKAEFNASGSREGQEFVFLNSKEEKRLVNTSEILFFEANKRYSKVYFLNSDCITLAKSLDYFEKEITVQGFLRVHKSYMVNISHIKKVIMNGQCIVWLTGNKAVPISRRKKSYVCKKLLGKNSL